MSNKYWFGFVTPQWLLDRHSEAMGGRPAGFIDQALHAISRYDESGYAFFGLDAERPVDVGLLFARAVVDEHAFLDGNKRTATRVFEYIVTSHGDTVGIPFDRLKDLINRLHGMDTDEFITFVTKWPNG